MHATQDRANDLFMGQRFRIAAALYLQFTGRHGKRNIDRQDELNVDNLLGSGRLRLSGGKKGATKSRKSSKQTALIEMQTHSRPGHTPV